MILTLLLLHLVVGAAIVASGDRFGRRAFGIAAIAPVAMLVWVGTQAAAVLDGDPVVQRIEWIEQLGLALDLRLDALGVAMVALVSGIGLLVCIYAMGYFSHPKPGTARLAGLLTLFAGAMLGIVLSDHLLALFVFWELTSITSYLLIGNDDRNPKARDAALSAILITGFGGLALIAGLVLVGQAAGTYRLSELPGAADGLTGTAVSVGLVLVLVGAFTKSAQVPFGGWLPGAMVAPTPISTYLHAATMVKAGVYLVARLSPVVADLGIWRMTIIVVSSATMITGGWRALRQHDLKLLLAYGTVSQLGFMMLLFGAGSDKLAQAGILVLIAHGAFKAALFMVVGIVDHQVGTRDVRLLTGFGRGWRPVIGVAVVAAASMAGIPPALGFIAKEKGLIGALDATFAGASFMVGVFVVGSVLTVAYSGRYVLGLLGKLHQPGASPTDERDRIDCAAANPPGPLMAVPPVLLATFTLAAGIAPMIVDQLTKDATTALYPDGKPSDVVLWAGFNTALVLSIVIVAVGVALMAARVVVERFQRWFGVLIAPVPTADRSFWGTVTGVSGFAKSMTKVVQNGSLPVYLMIILGVAALAPIGPAFGAIDDLPPWVRTWVHLPLAIGVVVAALGATMIRRRIAAALMLGAVGYAMAGFFVIQGAPDLALTQLAIETLATVLFVLVLRFLPRRFEDARAAVTAPIRLAVSVVVGVSVFVFALMAVGARGDVAAPSVSEEMLERSVPDAFGSNVVNVILVDFRGLDTLGEITVLVVAALGMVALARVVFEGQRPRTGARPSRFAQLPLLDTSTRLLYGSILVLSLYFLFAGHNQPGGGFVGGLTAGAALSLRYVAGGTSAVLSAARVKPWIVLGTGLIVAAGTAIVPLFTGNSLLEHADVEGDLPLLGTIKATSALPFDIGVYLVVVGLVLMAYEAFGDDARAGSGAAAGTEPSPGDGGEGGEAPSLDRAGAASTDDLAEPAGRTS